ncbi:MAG TPA: ABC transporter ATP-binding protein [Firmicutes bacterium]|jgi:multiple sugar transport system ATP-binding protein|nr:ABC transporter ATP-binding protein [Bacillota bacterium]
MEVKLQNLSKTFVGKKGDVTRAVDKMSITIPDGKLVGLLGPSGCGKSTTLYLIAGLHKPTEGQIFFGDSDVTNVPPEKRGIGLVFQNYALYPHFTVRGNILFPLENIKDYHDPETGKPRRYTKAEMNAITESMAELVDIKPYLERKPKQLSGGQQQRVAIARALAKRPRVLLLDEPLSNLDARLRLQTREEIKRIQRETGITTIFVTHDQEEAMSISDFIVVMEKGVVQQVDEPQKVYNEPINMFVAKFLGSPAINIIEAELRDGKLLLDGKMFDRGYESKGDLALDGQEVHAILKERGYTNSFEDFYLAMHQTMEHKEGNETVHVPFELTLSNVVIHAKLFGYKGTEADLESALIKIRIEAHKNRKVYIGIRPEAFTIEEGTSGKITILVDFIETIGRDISLVGKFVGPNSKARVIIPSELYSKVSPGKMTLSAKRFYVFETDGTRIK